nr:FecR domain-containing protein [Pseudoxanthomonas sp.]
MTFVRGMGIRAGLLLALASACVPAFAEDWVYRVRPGDTLWDLGGVYLKPGVDWHRLQQHNRIVDPYRLAPGSRLRIPLTWLRQQPAQARVIALVGQATAITSAGAERPVSEGMELGTGSRLLTALGASLSLQFADGSRLRLRESSELVLDRLTRYGRTGMVDTRVRLQRGRINNEVRRLRGAGDQFIVDTPTASSAVRGTRFRIHTGEQGMQAEVLDGRVAVTAGQQATLLKPGFGTRAQAGGGDRLEPIALLPAPDLSAIAAEQDSVRPQFAWPAVAGANGYRVLISRHPDFAALIADLVAPDASATAPALEPGQYHLRISAIDAQGLEGRDADAAFRIEGRPVPPYAVAPSAGSLVRQDRPALRWTQAPEAHRYRYEVADNPGFRDPIAQGDDLRGEAITVAKPLAPGAYYWRVGSIDAQGKKGPFGDAIEFTVRPLDPIDDIDLGKDGARADGITFHWRAGQPGQRYRFQMSRSPSFERLGVDEVVEQPEITLPKLAGGTWYLRAQAIDTDGEVGEFAPAQKIKLPCRLCRVGAGAGALLILLSL